MTRAQWGVELGEELAARLLTPEIEQLIQRIHSGDVHDLAAAPAD